MNKQTIETLLPCGEVNAIPTRELLRITGIKNSRTLQEKIQLERESGAKIISSHRGGYFLPDENPIVANSEVRTFIRTLRNRAKNTNRIARLVEQSAMSTPPGQLSIFNNDEDEV